VINPSDIIISSPPTDNTAVSTPRTNSSSQSENFSCQYRPVAITLLLWIAFFDLVGRTVFSIYTIFQLAGTFRTNHAIGHLYETSPLLCFSPLFYAILSVIILLIIFKTTSYSFRDFITLIFFALLVPISFSYYTKLISESLQLHPLLTIFNETNLIFILILLFILIYSRAFNKQPSNLSDQSAITVTIISSLILFPSFFFTYTLINTSLHPNIKKESIESLVDYKLYNPSSLPLNLRPDTTFYLDDKKYTYLPNQLVKIVYSSPKTKVTTDKLTIILNQSKVIPEFDLENFVTLQSSGQSTTKVVEISLAQNQKGIIKASTSTTSLSFITSDYILINIITPSINITSDMLIQIAESLR
jgi:hypothetical protein